MRRAPLFTVLAILVLAPPVAAEVRKAAGGIDLARASGDCSPIHSSSRDYPGFAVVKLSLQSDGKRLTISATLKDPPGDFASEVLYLYFDTDNDPKTGAPVGWPDRPGFEFKSELDACASYADRSNACVGGSQAKVTAHYAEASLERLKGTGRYDTETVVDLMGFPGRKEAAHSPIAANVVQAALDYADLKVKPGQTIRILVKEACGDMAPDHGYFPEILLTLK
jgi:hypothetical protein